MLSPLPSPRPTVSRASSPPSETRAQARPTVPNQANLPAAVASSLVLGLPTSDRRVGNAHALERWRDPARILVRAVAAASLPNLGTAATPRPLTSVGHRPAASSPEGEGRQLPCRQGRPIYGDCRCEAVGCCRPTAVQTGTGLLSWNPRLLQSKAPARDRSAGTVRLEGVKASKPTFHESGTLSVMPCLSRSVSC